MASPNFYPRAPDYFTAELDDERPIFQGDLFAGVFGAFWLHPDDA